MRKRKYLGLILAGSAAGAVNGLFGAGGGMVADIDGHRYIFLSAVSAGLAAGVAIDSLAVQTQVQCAGSFQRRLGRHIDCAVQIPIAHLIRQTRLIPFIIGHLLMVRIGTAFLAALAVDVV